MTDPLNTPSADSPRNPVAGSPVDNSIDDSIITVFTSLRETQPSSGFNGRLLETLAAHQAATARPSGRRSSPRLSTIRAGRPVRAAGFPQVLRATGWLSLAATLVLTLSLAFLHQPHSSLPANPAVAAPVIVSSGRPITLTSPNTSPNNSCCHPVRSEEPPYSALNHGTPRRTPLVAAASHPRHLASFPAPPLPLTAQEKLLLRVARARNPQQSPILNPTLRASLAAREDENFQIFFAPATTIKPYEPAN